MEQNYKSRSDSTRMKISNISWHNGISNYFKNNIPWQLSTGTQFAERLINVWLEHQPNKNRFYLLELGCGSGILSYNILNILKKDHPSIYKKTLLYITDGNQTQLDNISTSVIFNQHRNNIKFMQLNILKELPNFKHNFDLIFFTNLIDSLPTHHISKHGNTLTELVIEDKLKPDISFINTFSTQLEKLSAKKIQTIINSNDIDMLSIIGSDIIENLEETFHKLPLKKSKLEKSIQKQLHIFADTVPKNNNFLFNIQPDFISMIKNLLIKNPETLIIGNDFGVTNIADFNKNYKTLLATYGSTSFSTVFFPIFKFLFRKDTELIYTKNSFGKIQAFAIGHKSLDSKRKEKFRKEFKSFSEKCISNHISKIKTLLEKNHKVNKLKEEVNIKEFYLSSFLIANHLSSLKEHNEAIKICKKAIKYYDFMALPFKSLMAILYLDKKNYEKAYSIFDEICKIYKHIHIPYLGLYEAKKHLNKRDLVELLMIALKYAPEKEKPSILKKLHDHLNNN